MTFHAMVSLAEIGHYRLTHKWTNYLQDKVSNSQTRDCWFPLMTENGYIAYETKRCGLRTCWACQYRSRAKLRSTVSDFIQKEVKPNPFGYRFVTLTLPGSWYSVRHASVEEQLQVVRHSFKSLRSKLKRRGFPISGFYCIEIESSNSQYWHTHVHMIIRWKNQDYSELKEMWTKSVDRKTLAHLVNWELDPNNQRTVQVDRISSAKIADYLTKVTNYVTKVNDFSHNRRDIGEALYRRRTTGWLGDHYGFKKENNDSCSSTPTL